MICPICSERMNQTQAENAGGNDILLTYECNKCYVMLCWQITEDVITNEIRGNSKQGNN